MANILAPCLFRPSLKSWNTVGVAQVLETHDTCNASHPIENGVR
jgi:hypothetical protein